MIKKNISEINKKNLQKLLFELEDATNTIPNKIKNTFNFKGRKSSEIAKKVILATTKPEDLLYDPFMGSGSFVMAATSAGRKIIATELDNYTYSTVHSLFHSINQDLLLGYVNAIEKNIKSDILNLYETKCCNVKNYISKVFFDPQSGIEGYYNPTQNREFKDGENIKLITSCPICGSKSKKFDEFDEDKLAELDKLDVAMFPRVNYIENSRINITASTGANKYDRIFTNRNKKALLMIQEEIIKLPMCSERDVIEHALVSSLSLARIAMYGSSTDILYHVVPYGAQDMNVWNLFQSKINSIINFKKDFSDVITSNPVINDKYNLILSSYQEYCEKIKGQNFFDMIYTDFPYTDQVPYLERNQLYRVWLDKFYSTGEEFKLTKDMLQYEIVESNAPSRPDKNIKEYYKDIDQMFKLLNSVLKEEKLLVLTLKLGKSKYFTTLIEIINLARKNGFEYAIRIGIDKNDPSIRKQSAYNNTLSNEMIVVFEKLANENAYWYVGEKNYEFETVKVTYNYLKKSGNDISISSAVKRIETQLLKKENYIATEFDILRIHQIISRNFYIDEKRSAIRIDSNKLYLDIENNTDLFTKLYDYIPVIIKNLLLSNEKFVLDDLYFEIANTFCTGDPNVINQFLGSPSHQQDIERLLLNYCTTNGKVYVKKELDRALSSDAIDISTLDGYEFEKLIKILLEAEGFENVITTGGSGDLGVDILANKFNKSYNKSETYIFQCKRWAARVGSEPMQRLVAERLRRGIDYAACVTTSDYTEDGYKISREQDIEAYNGDWVLQKLDYHFKNKYYISK